MNLLPHFFSQLIRLISLFLVAFLASSGVPGYALEFCDIADLKDDYDRLTARDARVGPPDLFEARICTAWLWWKAQGPDQELQAPDAEFVTMVLENARQFKNVVTTRMKKLWDSGKRGKKTQVVNIDEAVPRAKQTSRALHAATLKAMQEGADLIVRPFLMSETRFAHPDFLIKVKARAPPKTRKAWIPVSSNFGFLENIFGQGAKFEADKTAQDYFYLPVIIKSGAPDVTNYAFDVSELKATPDFRLTVSSDYAVQMLHTLAVLQEIQYGVKAPEAKKPKVGEKFATADQRIFQPQGVFVLRNRGQLDEMAQDYMYFSFFSRDTTGGDEKRLNPAFDPGHRAHMTSFFNAQAAKNAEKVAPHRSSECKGCPLKDQHIPEMEKGKDVSLLYLADRSTVAHFQRTKASHGLLNTWEQIAKLDPKEAMALFPTLDGVGQDRVIPELYRFIRQARALQDNAAIDNSPIMAGIEIPPALVATLNAIGIWSFRQVLDLEAAGQWAEVVQGVTQNIIDTPADYAAMRKTMGGRKSAVSKAVNAATGSPFGQIWEYSRLRQEVSQYAPATQKGILGDMLALARFEEGYGADAATAQKHLQDLLAWAHALESYRYFDVLTITSTDPAKYSGRYAIYFDIEGDPEFRSSDAPWMKTEYAWGLRVVDLQTGKSVYEHVLGLEDFNLSGMRKVWEQWIEVVRRYPDAHVYYFSEYEPEVVKRFLRVFGPEIPKGMEIFDDQGLAYFDGLKEYRDFEKGWGMGLEDPATFNKQRMIAEFILRTTPELPQDLEQRVMPKARKTYRDLYAYVVEARDIQGRMVDFRREIMANFTLPVYAYDLKTLAKHYGFKWRDSESNALQSIVWFRQYVALKETDPERAVSFLNRIILYNTDDVRATEALHLMLKVRFDPKYLAHMIDPRKTNDRTSFLEKAIRDAFQAYNRLLAR